MQTGPPRGGSRTGAVRCEAERGSVGLPEVTTNEVVETGPGATRALAMIDEALRSARLESERIECVAVGIGPGSYTGIRAAIAVAQGWQLARDVPLVGISSVESVAAQAQADGLLGRVRIVVDAQRNEFYLATYEVTPEGRRELEPLRLAGLTEIRQYELQGEMLIGPDVVRWFPAGRTVWPLASVLGRQALGRGGSEACDRLEPIYLRETSFTKAPMTRVSS